MSGFGQGNVGQQEWASSEQARPRMLLPTLFMFCHHMRASPPRKSLVQGEWGIHGADLGPTWSSEPSPSQPTLGRSTSVSPTVLWARMEDWCSVALVWGCLPSSIVGAVASNTRGNRDRAWGGLGEMRMARGGAVGVTWQEVLGGLGEVQGASDTPALGRLMGRNAPWTCVKYSVFGPHFAFSSGLL